MPEPLTTADLNDRADRSWDVTAGDERHAAIAAEGKELAARFVAYCDEHYGALTTSAKHLTPIERAEHLFATFEIPESAKRLLLLWRNVLIEWERYLIARAEGRATEETGEVLAKASRQQLHRAADYYRETLVGREHQKLREDGAYRDQRLYQYNLLTNPWPTYREQLKTLAAQMTELQEGFEERLAVSEVFTELRTYVQGLPDQLLRDHTALVSAVTQAIATVRDPEATSVSKISTARLQSLEVLETIDARLDVISHRAATIIDKLPESAHLYTVDADGELRYRDLDMEYVAGQWISAELLPELQRGTRLIETATAELGRTLVDIRNRVALARETDTPENASNNEAQTVDRLARLLEGGERTPPGATPGNRTRRPARRGPRRQGTAA